MNTLFRPRDENLNLALTVLAIFFIAAEFYFGWRIYIEDHFKLIGFIAAVVLLETLHVVLTFVGVLLTPNLHRWAHSFTGGKIWKIGLRLAICFTLIFLFIFIPLTIANYKMSHSHFFEQVTLILIIMVTLHHRISQNQGISLSYARVLEVGSGTNTMATSPSAHLRRLEKVSFTLLLIFSGLTYLTFFGAWALRGLFGIEATFRESLMSFSAKAALASALSVVVLGVYQYFQYHRGEGRGLARNKLIYSLRAFFYPLAPISYCAFWATETLHGFEYVLLWRKLGTGLTVKPSNPNIKGVVFLAGAIIVIYYFLTFSSFVIAPSKTLLLRLIYSLYTAVTLTHFYADRMLFRMKNPASRSIIGPLIVGAPKFYLRP
jgi:hypothetical protein